MFTRLMVLQIYGYFIPQLTFLLWMFGWRLPSMTCDRCSSRVFFCFLIGWKADLSEESLFHHTLWIKWRLKKFRWFNGRSNGSSHKKIVIFGKTTFWKGCFKSLFDQDARDISDEVHFFTRPQVIPAFCSFIFKRITCFVYQVLSWYGVWCRALNNSQLAILPPGFFDGGKCRALRQQPLTREQVKILRKEKN